MLSDLPDPAPADTDWWRGAVIYQIYPRSFQDGDGDGVGDLRGIIDRLPHVATLGADAIWVSPFFPSPMRDFGYDVSDYCGVDPRFGTLADFDALVARAHALGLRVLIDLVLSHTSSEHPWFAESRADRHGPRADWYVWADARPDGTPPNNWLSLFGGSAWQWDTRRRQYYLHNFLSCQPDLNYHCPAVQEAALDVVRFWLARGVDGFRFDVVNFYFHDPLLRPNPPQPAGGQAAAVPAVNPYAFQRHLYDKTQPENLVFLQRLRALLDEFPGTTSIGEIGDDEQYRTLSHYTRDSRLHMAYTFNLMGEACEPAYVHAVLEEFLAETDGAWACWALNNHDVVRVATRWSALGGGAALAKLLLSMLGALRGSVCLYQGEELGLPEADIPHDRLQDPYGKEMWPLFKGRDGCRTPMPWEADAHEAGFTSGDPWLPVPPAHRVLAVDRQHAVDDSVLTHYRRWLRFRRGQPALIRGAMRLLPRQGTVLAWTRTEGEDQVLCVFNLSDREAAYELARGLDGAAAIEALDAGGHPPPPATGWLDITHTLALPPHGFFFGRVRVPAVPASPRPAAHDIEGTTA